METLRPDETLILGLIGRSEAFSNPARHPAPTLKEIVREWPSGEFVSYGGKGVLALVDDSHFLERFVAQLCCFSEMVSLLLFTQMA
jgi:hypothetical protein